ncbi:unnamed protein product [Aureobasidium uvarum]|uniref:Uncharacterized protein n=1 Tax=Aureobasidium uvarum TaxID=2773716 RepID=A0A9N8KIQ0_9PEZI|nr:unnamed protein product [Aureobasidium uvarum]
MCFIEKQMLNCSLCGGPAIPYIVLLGCPFGQKWGDCSWVFETVVNVTRSHRSCAALDQLCRDARMGITTDAHPAPVHVDTRMDVDPLAAPSFTTLARTTSLVPAYAHSFPASWTAGSANGLSSVLTLATQHRDLLVRMVEEMVPTVQDLRTSIAPVDFRLARVIQWSENWIAGMVIAANSHISNVHSAEFEIANNTSWAAQASIDITNIEAGLVNQTDPFEGAIVWHRRFTDLFIHLRRVAGQLSPPRPVTESPPPVMRRRGATAGLEEIIANDHSDFLPQPSFYLPEGALSDDGESSGSSHDKEQAEYMEFDE